MKAPINHGYMRSNNKRSVFNYIHNNSPVSKRDIAQQLKVSFTSVSTYIAELLKENLIISCGNAASTGGRKSELFRPNPDAFYVIGADIQIDCLVVLLLNACGMVIQKTVTPLMQQDATYVTGLLSAIITELCNKTDIATNKLVGIGMGVPGIVDHQSGCVTFAPNLSWKNIDLKALLNARQTVVIENEANAAVIGETTFGIAQGVENVIYVSIGAG
ncbi:MAG TPA: ROK family transcriptional regulator, partial [Bacillota bacterium]|nr:ROK family transcriptional regulator [Bacillota bacterium]